MNNGMTGKDDTMKAKIGEVKDKVGEVGDSLSDVKDKVIEVKDQMMDRGGMLAERVRTFTRKNPMQAIAIAFAVGFWGMRITRPLRWL
jgi:ElaB/YqjD/DUF883 family membrane-anchored ribosome-binding protein